MKIKSENESSSFTAILDTAIKAMIGAIMMDETNTRFISEVEIKLFDQGVASGLLRVEGNKVFLSDEIRRKKYKNPSQKHKGYDFFTFNREYLTQFVALHLLTTEYGYRREDCYFEYELMDIGVFQKEKLQEKLRIYVETKIPVSKNDMKNFLERIKMYGGESAAVRDKRHTRGNDPLCKANYILKKKPAHFWLVTPLLRWAFEVKYRGDSFTLKQIDDIPKASD